MVDISRKYIISATSREHGTHHNQDDSVLFLAKDKCLPGALAEYINLLNDEGANPAQIKSAELLLERVLQYQRDYPELVKVPDLDVMRNPWALEE
jgi:hypothetical protein